MPAHHLFVLLGAFLALFTTSYGSVIQTNKLYARDDNITARVPYVFPAVGTDAVADNLRSRRTNGTLLDLDGVLLNAPLIATGWADFFAVIRNNNSLPGDMRELLILRTAALNNAAYVWIQHEPVGLAEGLTIEQLNIVRFTPPFFNVNRLNGTLTPALAAAMNFADYVTVSVHVPDGVFNALKGFLNDTQLVEATATTGSYNFVTRFTVALNIDGKANVTVPTPA